MGLIISTDGIRTEEKRISAVRKLPKSELVRDIHIFIGFVNFYRHFIKGFSMKVAQLITILKTTGSSVASAFRVDDDEFVGSRGAVGEGAIDRGAIGRGAISWSDVSRKSVKSKRQTKSGHLGNSNYLKKPKFLISKDKKAFNRLRQAFTKVPTPQHFDPKCQIQIETNASGYAI